MKKIVLALAFVLLGSFMISGCSKDEILDHYNNIVQSAGAIELTEMCIRDRVFAFKVAFLKVIEESMDTKLFIVLDSPKGKELDDDRELCALIKRSVQAENIEADFCNTGKEGLQKLKEQEYNANT